MPVPADAGWLYMSTGGDAGKLKLMETMAKRAERKGKLAAKAI